MSLYYKEEQRFNSWWVIVLFITLFIGLIIPIYQSVFMGDDAVPLTLLLTVLATMTLVATLIFRAKLELEIDRFAIRYRFSPFINSWKRIDKSEILKAEVVKYNPITEYGGYGYRRTFNKGKALNVKGSIGLRILYGKNKKLLIGTQKPEELKPVIESLLESKTSDNG
ncbi:MAG: hypothetical protein WBA74_00245 [Cyclobacteriaceae bacterium]